MALSFFGPTLEKGTEQQARNGCRIHRAGSHGYVSCIQISNILAVNIVIVMQGYEPLDSVGIRNGQALCISL